MDAAGVMSGPRTLTSVDALVEAGLLSADESEAMRCVEERYAIALTPHLREQIDQNNPNDPIARMFVPQLAELETRAEELFDPIGDEANSPVKGIVHRYPDRVLLKPVGVCPVYCRFCFRREMVGPQNADTLSPSQLGRAIDYIRAHPEIREVILTGGDPFMLSPTRMRQLGTALAKIEHLDVIRWHTRMPVAVPSRIDEALCDALVVPGKAVWVSIHVNHARELTPEAAEAAKRLLSKGLPLVSQSVLLKGINNTIEALVDLMRALLRVGIKPYYLHHPDLAPGTGHFRVSIEEGQALYRELVDRVSGLAVPDYVLDIPGGVSKARIASSDCKRVQGGHRLRGRDGEAYFYPDER